MQEIERLGHRAFVGEVKGTKLDRAYIGRTFCVVVMAGLGSMPGTIVAGVILGVAEEVVKIYGASWAPAISFGLLLLILAVRPQGLFGR